MSNTNNYGPTVSRTLQTDATAYDLVLWQQGKPPLDSELNLLSDIHSEGRRRLLSEQTPSGFLNVDPFTCLPLDIAHAYKFDVTPSKAVVNGWLLDVNFDGVGQITMPPAPVGSGNHRWDFVFLEVWKVLISGGSASGKPSTTEVYKDGNVQNLVGNLSDDIKDTVVGIETTKRVQIQYRYRVEANVGTPNSQNSNGYVPVLAQGPMVSPVAGYSFSNMGTTLNDHGLWRAGNGDNASRTQLGTVDGYVYSIPVALVFRRAIAPYNDMDLNGQHCAANNIASLVSDRIDDLFYDSIDTDDILDLRHKVHFSMPHLDAILRDSVKSFLSARNTTKHAYKLQYEVISETGVVGYSNLNTNARADQVRTKWSDLQSSVVSHVAKLAPVDTDSNYDWFVSFHSSGPTQWDSGDVITLNVPTDSPAGTVILGTNDALTGTKPFVYYNKAGLVPVNGTWAGCGTASATFTLGTNVGLVNEEIWIAFDVQYPENEGLTHIPNHFLKLDYVNYVNFPTIQTAYTTYYGTVRAGLNLLDSDLPMSFGTKEITIPSATSPHLGAVNNVANNYRFERNNKELEVTPIIKSTNSTGTTRLMSVRNYHNATKRVRLPLPCDKTWFVRGVYDANFGGTEIATTLQTPVAPSLLNGLRFVIPTAAASIAEVVQVIYTPGPTDLTALGYKPVFIQAADGDIDSFVLVNANNEILDPSGNNTSHTPAGPNLSGAIASQYTIQYRYIPTVNVNAYVNASVDPNDNWIECDTAAGASTLDNTELWLDIDYVGQLHSDGQLKIVYAHLPYQGLVEDTGTILEGELKEMVGFVHTDGTKNVLSNINRDVYPFALASLLPTHEGVDHTLTGGSVAGPGPLGMFASNPLCFVNGLNILEHSTGSTMPLSTGEAVTAKFDLLNGVMERGGNTGTSGVDAMLPPLSVSTNRQAVIFGLAIAGDNFDVKNELLLYVMTTTGNSDSNVFSSNDVVTIGVDFFFIPGRPLVK